MFIFSALFFLYQPSQIGCLPYFHTWCGLSDNFRCRSETCCTRLAENTGRKKSPKIAIWASSHNLICPPISSQRRHVSTIGKKRVITAISPPDDPHNMVNFGPLTAEIDPVIWGIPANFNGFRVLASLLHGLQYWASARLCGVQQRAPPIFGRAAITFGIGPHSSLK